jgi:hypothetical protein
MDRFFHLSTMTSEAASPHEFEAQLRFAFPKFRRHSDIVTRVGRAVSV